jgi:hypothetical protein
MEDQTRKLILAVATTVVASIIAILISITIRESIESEYEPVDSLERRAIPIEVVGSKYPSLRMKLLEDSQEECFARIGHKLRCTSDTLTVRIFLNKQGERLHTEIIEP